MCSKCDRREVRRKRGSHFRNYDLRKVCRKIFIYFYATHGDSNIIKSLEMSNHLSVQIFRILRICTSQFAFFIKTLIFYGHDNIS